MRLVSRFNLIFLRFRLHMVPMYSLPYLGYVHAVVNETNQTFTLEI